MVFGVWDEEYEVDMWCGCVVDFGYDMVGDLLIVMIGV